MRKDIEKLKEQIGFTDLFVKISRHPFSWACKYYINPVSGVDISFEESQANISKRTVINDRVTDEVELFTKWFLTCVSGVINLIKEGRPYKNREAAIISAYYREYQGLQTLMGMTTKIPRHSQVKAGVCFTEGTPYLFAFWEGCIHEALDNYKEFGQRQELGKDTQVLPILRADFIIASKQDDFFTLEKSLMERGYINAKQVWTDDKSTLAAFGHQLIIKKYTRKMKRAEIRAALSERYQVDLNNMFKPSKISDKKIKEISPLFTQANY